jgi:predicted MFS family arabinose efflux permease
VVGLLAAGASGLLYLLSLGLVDSPVVSVTLLLLGRALLGGAESFIITGAVSWGLALVDAKHAGKVIAWVGTAMFAALALGAPVGTSLYATGGFAAIALATTLVPVLTLLLVVRLPATPRRTHLRSRPSSAWPRPSGCRGWARRSAASALAPFSRSVRSSSPNAGGVRSGSRSAHMRLP